jgi:hypothetical protein
MNVCMNICVYVCMFVCMYVYLFVCMYVCMGVKLEDCKNLPSHLSSTKVNVCLYINCICVYIYIFLFLVPILKNFKMYFSGFEI